MYIYLYICKIEFVELQSALRLSAMIWFIVTSFEYAQCFEAKRITMPW